MSVLVQSGGVLEDPTILLLPDTAVNDVLSMAAATKEIRTVVGIIVVNRDASARQVDIWLTVNTTDRLIFSRSIAAGETVTEALAYPLRLYAKSTARKIKAQASAAAINTVTITLITTQSQQSGNQP